MNNEMNLEGIRLAYVHLSVTTPRTSGPRVVPAETAPVTRGADHRLWDRAVGSRPAEPAGGLAA